MAKSHGKSQVVKLDNPSGSITDISAYIDNFKRNRKTERLATQTFGDIAERRQLKGLRGATYSFDGFWMPSSTTKVHGKATRVLLDQYNPASYLDAGSVKRTIALPPSHTFGDSDEEFDIIGLMAGSVSFSGFFDGASAAAHDIFRALLDAADTAGSIGTAAPNGFTIGNEVLMFVAPFESYDVDGPETGPVKFSVAAPCDNYVDSGVSLRDLTAETTGAATTNYTAVDGAAASTDGGVAHLHVTAFSGFTSATYKVQHSTDNVTFADLVTFTAATGATKERVVVAAGTTVNRYVRASVTIAGASGSVTAVVAFARRTFVQYGTSIEKFLHALYANQTVGTTYSFEYHPQGTGSGAPKETGEGRIESFEVTFSETAATRFSGVLRVTGAVTEGTN